MGGSRSEIPRLVVKVAQKLWNQYSDRFVGYECCEVLETVDLKLEF
jgi:hypothetical protein